MPRTFFPPTSRQLKSAPATTKSTRVSGRHRPPVPFIRPRGYWLDKAGFGADQRVNIQVTHRCITLVPADA